MSNILIVIFFSLILANSLHMFVVKLDFFSFLNIPISEKKFGKNKSIRGFVVVPILTALLFLFFSEFFLDNYSASEKLIHGLLFGLVYCLFELPNSCFKRKMGIAPGQSHQSSNKLFIILDKTDSNFGCSILYCFLYGISLKNFLTLFTLGIFFHSLVSFVLVKLGVKKSF